MASLLRPSMFRPACTAASTRLLMSTNATSTASIALPLLRSSVQTAFRQQFTKPSFVRGVIPASARVAAFHTSARRDILPPLPQHIEGTANEAAPVPHPDSPHGAYHWTFERLVSIMIVPLTIAPFVGGSLNPVLDGTLCALLIAHSHVGFESCIIDYFPMKRVPKTRVTLDWTLRIATILVAVGLYEFETNDVGLTEAVKRIWKA